MNNIYKLYNEKQEQLKQLEQEIKILKDEIISQMKAQKISEYIDRETLLKFSYREIHNHRKVIDKEFVENELPLKYKNKLYKNQSVNSTTLWVRALGGKENE